MRRAARGRSAFVLALAVSVVSWPWLVPARYAVSSEIGRSPPSIDIPQVSPSGRRRPISLEDILSLREIREPALSPDRTRVAYLVRQSFLSCNCGRTALYVGSSEDAHDVRKIDEEAQISDLRWTPDGRHLSFLTARDGAVQLWWVPATGGAATPIFVHRPNPEGSFFGNALLGPALPVGVASYEWSPGGKLIAFTAVKPDGPKARRNAETEGFRYDDTHMTVMDLTTSRWLSAERTVQLWVYDLRERHERLLWETPPGTWANIQNVEWSPDGERLALSYPYGVDVLSHTAAIIDARTGRWTKLFDAHGLVTAIAWAGDGRSTAILSRLAESDSELTLVPADGARSGAPRTVARDLSPGITPSLRWTGARLYFESAGIGPQRSNGGLYELNPSGATVRRITSPAEKVADCGPPVGSRVACVWQAPTHAPRVAVVDLATASVALLQDVNPELSTLELGPVEEIEWSNKFGDPTNGYLLLPPGRRTQDGRLPLLVIAYGFDGDFVAQANWSLSSYPAQAFARDGFAVLLINHPKWGYWTGSDFARGARAWGYGPLSSLKVIIERLRREGIVDESRIGFMGHSWGGFWARFAASHSSLLRAIETLNGGTQTEPGSYWDAGHAAVRTEQDRFMGGGPYPPTLKNYLGFSSALTADRVRIPVLLEADAPEAPFQLEYYTALRAHQVPVDFIVYPNDGHNLATPSHRLASMRRNLDWFEFWLLGKARTDPSAADQYATWKLMRNELAALERER